MKTSKFSFQLLFISLFALALAQTCFGQNSILLHVDGVPGESTSKSHPGDIVATGFSFGVANQPASAGTGSGKAVFTDFSVTKFIDKASPLLMLKAAGGNPITTVELFVQNSSAPAPVDYYKVTLSQVYVTGVNTTGAVSDRPTETVTFKFGQIKIEYTLINPDGTQGGTVMGCWDINLNRGCGT